MRAYVLSRTMQVAAHLRWYYCADATWCLDVARAAVYMGADAATNMARTLGTAIGAYVTVEVRK